MNYKIAIELGRKARQNGLVMPPQDDELMKLIKQAGSAEVVVLCHNWYVGWGRYGDTK